MRRALISHDPRRGIPPSRTMLASVRLSAADPLSPSRRVPARFSMTSSEERRSPYFTLNPPVASSNREIVSGLNALVRPYSR